MSLFKIAMRSFAYYLHSNFVLALGVAAATAVLTGALIVGDSMRTSLRNLALDRLGRIDQIVVSDGFFGAEVANQIEQTEEFKSQYSIAIPVILFPNGSVEISDGNSNGAVRASGVNVFGIPPEFWQLADTNELAMPAISARQIVINETLAQQLGVAEREANAIPNLTLRVPKPSQLPSDSSLGKKEDLVESLVELEVVEIAANKSIGRFGLHVSQLDSPNIFVPIELLSRTLQRKALKHREGLQANAILLSGNDKTLPSEKVARQLLKSARFPLADYGLTIKDVSQVKADSDEFVFNYFSLSSDRLVISNEIVDSIQMAFPDAVPVFTYLANDIRSDSELSGIPFSMMASIEIGPNFPLVDVKGNRIESLDDHEIVLNQWAANDLDVTVGNSIIVKYFPPESTHGAGEELEAFFKIKAIARLAQPDTPFEVRRQKVVPAQFLTESPTLANDPDLTPEVSGLTDAQSIDNWDLPFATADKIRAEDDDYWNDYRTTPKAFVSLSWGQQLWGSRFGEVTSFRIPKTAGTMETVRNKLLDQFQSEDDLYGFSIIPIRQSAVKASSGSTPFDVLFLALSMFVIASALILVSLLFRLALQRRASELGAMMALGIDRGMVTRSILIEMVLVVIAGVALGLIIGVAYAAIMIFGLTTWWVGAISKPILELFVARWVLLVGAVCGLVICLITIAWTIRNTRQVSIRQLLSGLMSRSSVRIDGRRGSNRYWILGLLIIALTLSIVASFLGGEPQAGAFMGAGFMVLAAGMVWVYGRLTRDDFKVDRTQLNLRSLAAMSGKRNPLRSTLTIGLVAVASFLIVAVSSFRLSPNNAGTAGFDLIASSEGPIYESLTTSIDDSIEAYSIRFKSGEDASCNNLYQSTQPSVLGVNQQFIDSFKEDNDFRWASVDTKDLTFKRLPWNLLNQKFDDGAIPVVIDKNTANYSLKIFQTGGIYHVDFDSGESVDFQVVGFLENSILQGSLIISEDNFVTLFANVPGYRKFLIREKGQGTSESVSQISAALEERFSDQGLDAKSAVDVLAQFQAVQNTYISTFQTLGGLGLLLGTFGLAVVQIRSVLERQKELGLMRSVGFDLGQLSKMVLLENLWLLFAGMAVGVFSALVTTLPHFLVGGASIPWLDLAILFAVISVFGLLAAYIASRTIASLPLIDSLRSSS